MTGHIIGTTSKETVNEDENAGSSGAPLGDQHALLSLHGRNGVDCPFSAAETRIFIAKSPRIVSKSCWALGSCRKLTVNFEIVPMQPPKSASAPCAHLERLGNFTAY